MKNIKISILILLAAFSFCACDDLLTEEPTSIYVEQNYYTSPENAQLAVFGAYSVLNQGGMYGQYMNLVYPYDNDLAQFSTKFVANQMRETIAKYYITANNNNLESSWKALFWGIQKANEAIKGIRDMEMLQNGSDEEKAKLNRSLGEALFLRGWLYLDLVKNWGGVPIITEPVNLGQDIFPTRATSFAVYDQIISDMKEAAELLPWQSDAEVSERPKKGAVKGMLARVYLYAAGFTLQPDASMKRPENFGEYLKNALLELDAVIASGEHALNADFREVFYNYHRFQLEPKESMLEVPFYATDGASGGTVGQIIGVNQHVRSQYSKAIGKVQALRTFYDSFAEDDTIRQELSVAQYKIPKNGKFTPIADKQCETWTCGKWRRHWIYEFNGGYIHNNVNCTNMNWVKLRYSDVLLMFAEAYNECEKIGNLPSLTSGYSKYDALNEVRTRAKVDAVTDANVAEKAAASHFAYADSPDNFSVVVRDERAWELSFEGLRKYDLLRWNSLGTAIQHTYTKLKEYRANYPYMAGEEFEANKDELYAIPRREMIENPNLEPNPSNL